MEQDKIKITDVKPNPKNPRYIKDDKLEQLKKSIQDFPEMLKLRPLIVDENNVLLGGNMRLKALKQLGYTHLEKDWVKKETELTEKQKKEFLLLDNVSFGDWNNSALDSFFSDTDTLELIETSDKKLKDVFNNENGKYNQKLADYPVTVVLTFDEWKQWEALKKEVGEEKDNKAFFKIAEILKTKKQKL